MVDRYYSKPAYEDPRQSVDVFDRLERNEWGRPACVAAAVSQREGQRLLLVLNGRACLACSGEGERIIEEHLGDGVYSAVEAVRCGRCHGTGRAS